MVISVRAFFIDFPAELQGWQLQGSSSGEGREGTSVGTLCS